MQMQYHGETGMNPISFILKYVWAQGRWLTKPYHQSLIIVTRQQFMLPHNYMYSLNQLDQVAIGIYMEISEGLS
jgi:hypothetical protein